MDGKQTYGNDIWTVVIYLTDDYVNLFSWLCAWNFGQILRQLGFGWNNVKFYFRTDFYGKKVYSITTCRIESDFMNFSYWKCEFIIIINSINL